MPLRLPAFLFFSGFAALTLEIAWIRRLSTIVGHSADAAGIVVAVFLLGLSLGSELGLNFPGRGWKRLAALEAGIAFWALASPPLADFLHNLYLQGAKQGLPLFILSLGLAGLALLPPTMLMGATLPLAVALTGTESLIRRVYAYNTFGATVGALGAGWLALPWLGVRGTFWLGAGANLLAAVFIWRATTHKQSARPLATLSQRPGLDLSTAGWFAFWSGAAALAVQMTWTRSLALLLGASVYGYSSALAICLAGMALGCALPVRQGRLGWLTLLASLATTLTHLLLPRLPEMGLAWGVGQWQAPTVAGALLPGLLLASMILILPSMLLGILLPTALEDAPRDRIGRILAANTFGAMLACLAVPQLAIPALGIEGSLKLSAGFLLTAWLCLKTRRVSELSLALLSLVSLLVVPSWNHSATSAGGWIYAKLYTGRVSQAFQAPAFYADGRCATVSVTLSQNNLALRINGKVDASLVREDRQTMLLTGYIPALIHPYPRSSLVIGLGSGLTLHALANVPSIHSIRCLELEQKVVEANRFWDGYNGHVLQDPRVQVEVADGRTALMTSNRKYDLICSEPSNLWVGGVGGLFTREFYLACQEKLETQGVMCQWLQLYGMSPAELQTVLGTFYGVFPEGTLWQSAAGDLLLIGSREPHSLDLRRLRQLWKQSAKLRDDWVSIDLYRPECLLGHYLQSRAQAEYPRISPHTDDRPSLEFTTPISYYLPDSVATNLGLLRLQRGTDACLPDGVAATPGEWIEAAHGWLALNRLEPIGPLLSPFKNEPGCSLVAARAAQKTGQPVAAQLYRQALQENPRDALTLWLSALYWDERQEPERALALLKQLSLSEKGLSLPGLERRLALTRSELKQQLGDLAGARRDLEEALSHLPEADDLLERLARLYEAENQFRKADSLYQRAIRLNPSLPSAWLGAGRCQYHLGHRDRARNSFLQVLKLQPSQPDALANLLVLREPLPGERKR